MTKQLIKQGSKLLKISSNRNLYHVSYLARIASTDITHRMKHNVDTPINHWEESAFWSYRTSTEYVKAIDKFTDEVREIRPKPGVIGMELVLQRIRYWLNIQTFNPVEDSDEEEESFKVNVNHRGTFSRLKNAEWQIPYFPVKPSENEDVFDRDMAIVVATIRLGTLVTLFNSDPKDWGRNAQERRKFRREYPMTRKHPYSRETEPFLKNAIVDAIYHLVDFSRRDPEVIEAITEMDFNPLMVREPFLKKANEILEHHEDAAARIIENIAAYTGESEDDIISELLGDQS